jgi:hypothetical protein
MRITGKVTDFEGFPLKDVHISIKPLFSFGAIPMGTITNAFGAYAIEANLGDTLKFSHVTAPDDRPEITVKNANPINIALMTGTQLNEVVVSAPNKSKFNWWWLLALLPVAYYATKDKETVKKVKV